MTVQRHGLGRASVVTIAGKRVAVDRVSLKAPASRGAGAVPPRLRFDRVVLELMSRLRTALEDVVPRGRIVVVTVTAPIRLASKTAGVIEERVRAMLRRRSGSGRFAGTIHGNAVQIRIMRRGNASTAKLAGFVHNRDSDRAILFDLADALLRGLASAARRRCGRSSLERWLVIALEDAPTWAKTCRHVCDQLLAQGGYARVLVVGPDGNVDQAD